MSEFHGFNLAAPPTRLLAVTPDDGNDLARECRAINVAASGNVKVTTIEGDDATVYIAAGIAFPLRARRIWATGTTATGIVALA